jgi:hypothetical protein
MVVGMVSSALVIRARARIRADGIMQGEPISHIINGGRQQDNNETIRASESYDRSQVGLR